MSILVLMLISAHESRAVRRPEALKTSRGACALSMPVFDHAHGWARNTAGNMARTTAQGEVASTA